MNKFFFLLVIIFLCASSYKKNEEVKKQNEKPILFAEGIISTEDDEFGATFTPDGKTCYFTMKSPSTISSSVVVICVSHFQNGQWTAPEIASFSGKYHDFNPCISPDGEKLFFISSRPFENRKSADADIWMVKKTDNGWSEPENIGAPVNTKGWELGCSVASDGTLYFSTTGISGNPDLYKSKFENGKYQKPESLGDSINSIYSETDLFIAPDQNYILFASQGRPDGMSDAGASVSYPRGDLYISFNKDGKWTSPKNLGADINSIAEESNPWVSHDGTTLYFTSERNFISIPMNPVLDYNSLEKSLHSTLNGLGNIYQVSVSTFMNQFH